MSIHGAKSWLGVSHRFRTRSCTVSGTPPLRKVRRGGGAKAWLPELEFFAARMSLQVPLKKIKIAVRKVRLSPSTGSYGAASLSRSTVHLATDDLLVIVSEGSARPRTRVRWDPS